jgi:hypothetical protein
LFKNLLSLFAPKKPAPTQTQQTQVETNPAQQFPVRELSSADEAHPFNVDGYDCLSFVRSRISTSGDPAIAERFLSLREHTGKSYAGDLPTDAIKIEAALSYPAQQVRDGILRKASRMEEKWDIYLYDGRMYFCRSWTGTLVYVASFEHASSKIQVDTIWVAQEAACGNPEFSTREVDYLIKNHVMHKRVPHPLPPDLQRDLETIGQYSFSQYGHECCFGTYADTLPSNMLKNVPAVGKPSNI